MRKRDAHRRLLALLSVAMGASLLLLAGCGGVLLPEAAAPFESHDQVADAFDQIVPGMTRADDLPHLGFDTQNADMLTARQVEQRLGAGDPAVRSCIEAGLYCTGFAFHAAATTGLLQRVSHSEHPAGDIILLVMNGRVMHKVFSAGPARKPEARVASAF